MTNLDAVVVGSGPNGLAAALTLARAGLAVEVMEGASRPGGGCRTEELTLPGYRHDVCSSVHPLMAASPFFATAWSQGNGPVLLQPEVAFAHPLGGGRAAALYRDVAPTAAGLGPDGPAYLRLLGPVVGALDEVVPDLLGPLRSLPHHPAKLARLMLPGLLPVTALAACFRGDEARALLAGAAAHSVLPLSHASTGAYGLLFSALGHRYGWPVVEGGSQGAIDALISELEALGTTVRTGTWARDLGELPAARVALMDVGPRQLCSIAGDRLGPRYSAALRRYRPGAGVFKVDWALSGPVPWTAEVCRRAGTLHLGGTLEEIAAAEAEVAAGRHPERPFCLMAQPGVVDPTRAPGGGQTLWGYCHVPNGSTQDMATAVEDQVERFAPGFRDLVLARSTRTAAQLEQENPNYVGGDIAGGAALLRQVLARPTWKWDNYRTPAPGVLICSSSTPPGAGVHGMCGYWAARSALAWLGDQSARPGDVAGVA